MNNNPNTIGAALRSAGKLLLQCRRHTLPTVDAEEGRRGLIILGNGPSLRQTLDNDREALRSHHLMMVNFSALTPEFEQLKPSFYILADPHFGRQVNDPNVQRLREALQRVDWPMTLLLPHAMRAFKVNNPHITTARYNMLGIEAPGLLRDIVYDRGWGMPRPHNVLIPAIMCAAVMGYRNIWIVGADHSWPRTVAVNSHNEVVPNQPHFYPTDAAEEQRINTAYTSRHLYEVLYSWYITFRGYHDIQRWARRRGINIVNATPTSLIDAFPRQALPKN